jgi:hypothetical protein
MKHHALFFCALAAALALPLAGCGCDKSDDGEDGETDGQVDPVGDDAVVPDPAPDPDLSDPVPDPVEEELPGACSGHGTLMTWPSGSVCACSPGYTPSTSAGSDCVPTSEVCKGGSIPEPIDVNGDGSPETSFEPSAIECQMYELVNYTRASHDAEGTPECHQPLMYNLEWSAHGRNHCWRMYEEGGLFHEDYPYGQNCAYGCDPACEIEMYMNGSGEDHCPPLSHHCNIMSCDYSEIGIGYWTPDSGTYNTQNFL